MFEHICSRCGRVSAAPTYFEAENLFNQHECEGMRSLSEMPSALLLRVINKELTEAEAWILADATKGIV